MGGKKSLEQQWNLDKDVRCSFVRIKRTQSVRKFQTYQREKAVRYLDVQRRRVMHGTKAKNEQLFADEQTSPTAPWKKLSWLENKRRLTTWPVRSVAQKILFVFLSLCVCAPFWSWQPYLHPPWAWSNFRMDSSKIIARLPPNTDTHTLTLCALTFTLLLPLNTGPHRSRLNLDFLSLPEIAWGKRTGNTLRRACTNKKWRCNLFPTC